MQYVRPPSIWDDYNDQADNREPFATRLVRAARETLAGEHPIPRGVDREAIKRLVSDLTGGTNAPAANRRVVAVQSGTLGGTAPADGTDASGGETTYIEPPSVFTENENRTSTGAKRMTTTKNELRQLSKELTARYGVGQDHVPAVALNVDAEDRAAKARGHLDAIDEEDVPEGLAEPLQNFRAALGTITERVQEPGGEDERSFVNGLENALNDLRAIEREELTDEVGQAVRELRQAIQQSEENLDVEVDVAENTAARRDLERKLAHSTPFDRDELEGRSREELTKIARLAENSGGVEHVPPPKVF